ncbi:hypothetical protein CTB96_18200 [Cryobacterium arcticum]|uniref:Orc1-like AAA ATPase domain-containing protein n=1 Tax=Cryobacterium arcticum TaxID=670052 RepID=A0A317ZTR0_9MICO|nr:hypothetical protein CTB96_18200 [Cryobacterium arcticum]
MRAPELSLFDVFGVSREIPLNYVVREKVDGVFLDALTQHKHLVIHGSSKQGKTSLRKHTLPSTDYIIVTCSNKWNLAELHAAILKAAGYKLEGTTIRTTSGDLKVNAKLGAKLKLPFIGDAGAEVGTEASEATARSEAETSLELDAADVNDIIDALDKSNSPKRIVLEDFHYLPEETQTDFAVALKAFHEDSAYCFIVVGVWLDENRLLQHNGDLGGRLLSVNADKWTVEELKSVMNVGSAQLNIKFTPQFMDSLIDGSLSSVWIVQEVCKLACERAGVYATQENCVVIDDDVPALITQVVNQDTARYVGFLSRFAGGIQNTRLEMFRWILMSVLLAELEDLTRGLTYGWLTQTINMHHPTAPVNAGNITQALQSTASLQLVHMKLKPIILDYNQTARRLTVVDRSFMIWLQHQDRAALISELELS